MIGLEEIEEEFASHRRAAAHHEFSAEQGRGESLELDEAIPRRGSLDSGYWTEDYINAALEEVECPNDSDIESEFDEDDQSASSIASSTTSSDAMSLQDEESCESECEEVFLGDTFQNTGAFSSFRGDQNEEEDDEVEEDSLVGLDGSSSMPSLSSFNQDSAGDLFAEDSVGPNSSMPSLRSWYSPHSHDSLRSLLSEDSLQEGEEGKFSMQENTRLFLSSVVVAEHDPCMPNLEELQLEEDSFSTNDSEKRGFINKKD